MSEDLMTLVSKVRAALAKAAIIRRMRRERTEAR